MKDIKPPHPAVDLGLGIAFLCEVAYFLLHLSRNPQHAPLFAGFVVLTLVMIISVRHNTAIVGRWISSFRRDASIPESCRDPLSNPITMRKFKDQAWQFFIHASMACWEVRILKRNPQWWRDPTSTPCPTTVQGEHFDAEVQQFMLLQLAVWMLTAASCKWFEERRKDYVEMMGHHVVTVLLILMTQIYGEMEIGLVVLTVHDVSDVVLDLMKMANYVKLEDAHGCYLTEILFVLNTYVTWPYFRLFVFPCYVLHAVIFGYARQCGGVAGSEAGAGLAAGAAAAPGTLEELWRTPGWIAVRAGLLSVLLLLHVFWWFLLNRIGFRMLMGSSGHDAGAAEYEGEDGGARGGRGGKKKQK